MRDRRLAQPGLPPQPAAPRRAEREVNGADPVECVKRPGVFVFARETGSSIMIDPTERVAIVGIGGIFPGAPDLERFWANVAAGVDATTEVPPGRWALDPADAFDPGVATPDRVYSTRGGFVEGFRLDPEGLDLDPALVDRLDPMFHLALHAGRQAWRDAATEDVDRARVGVVFGNIVLPTETASALARETLGRTFDGAGARHDGPCTRRRPRPSR